MNNGIGLLLTLICFTGASQSKLRKFSNIVNHPAINIFAPYISADGQSLVYLSDDANDNLLTLFYTKKKDAVNWEKPSMIPRSTVNTRLAFPWGFALSANGETLYFTSLLKGLGGFDIYVSKLQGSSWSPPANVGMPINSATQEGSPAISADGNYLYFMRCESMSKSNAKGCMLLISQKTSKGAWGEPVPLPDHINTGNSQTPRILPDGETLLFSSDRFPQGKGNMDLYLTRFDGAQWSDPVPLAFANTEGDDQYVSTSAFGRYLLKAQPGTHTSEIVEILFPPTLKPKSCMIVRGEIMETDNPLSTYINVFDREKNKRIYKGAAEADGTFVVYLKQGAIYDVAVEPEKSTYTFYSKTYDLRQQKIRASSKIIATIEPVSTDTEIDLEGITFEPHTAQITKGSAQELRRLARMIKANSDRVFQIGVSMEGYRSDTIQLDPDLTELMIDSIRVAITRQVPIVQQLDSITMPSGYDSTTMEAGNDQFSDSTTVTIDSMVVKTTYHNDRTALQVQTITDLLISKGIPAERLAPYHKVVPLPPTEGENKKIRIWVKTVQ